MGKLLKYRPQSFSGTAEVREDDGLCPPVAQKLYRGQSFSYPEIAYHPSVCDGNIKICAQADAHAAELCFFHAPQLHTLARLRNSREGICVGAVMADEKSRYPSFFHELAGVAFLHRPSIEDGDLE